MEKYIFDKSNGLWYELRGDYYIPCLTVPAEEEKPIGIWGRRHLQYIKKERKALYTELLTSGRLSTYLADINEQAMERMLLLTKQMADHEGVNEQLDVRISRAQNRFLLQIERLTVTGVNAKGKRPRSMVPVGLWFY